MTVFASKCERRPRRLDNLLYPLHKSCEAANRRPSRLVGVRRKTLQTRLVRKLRRTMVDLNPVEAMETLIAALRKHKTNDELLAKLL